MTLYCFPEWVVLSMFSSREYVGSVSQDETHSFSCCVWVSYLRRAKQKDIRQKLELGTETAVGVPPYTHRENLNLLHQLQAADSSFLSGKYFAWCFLKLWKIIQHVSEAEKMGSLICSCQGGRKLFNVHHYRRYFRTWLS